MHFKNKSKLLLSKTFTKMLITYILIIIFTIISISIILYFNFSKAAIEDIQKNTQEKLSQNINQLEFINNQVTAVGFQLLNDSNVISALYSKELNKTNNYITNNYLTNLKLIQVVNINPMISSIYVYNDENKSFISSLGIENYNQMENKMRDIVKNYSEKDKLKFIPSTFINKTRIGVDYNDKIISMVFGEYLNINSDNKNISSSRSMVIINLKAEYIQKIFTKQYNSNNSNIILINKGGDVISDSNFTYFSKNISKVEYVKSILSSNKQSGYLTREDASGKFLISYESIDSSPYIFINKTNYNVLLAKNKALRFNIFMICFAILLVCIAISIFAFYNLYLPFHNLAQNIRWKVTKENEIKQEKNSYNDIEYLTNIFSNIIDKTDKLESSIIDNSSFMKEMFLKTLVEGNTKSSMDIYKKIDEIKLNIATNNICVILFSIDKYSKFLKSEVQPFRKELVFEVESIIKKIINQDINIPIELIYSGHGLITLITNNKNEEEFHILIKNKIQLIQECIINNFGITISAVIGLTVDNIENTFKSYDNCITLLKYRFVYGYKSILENNIIDNIQNNKITSIEKYKKKIIENIKECNIVQLEVNINLTFKLIANNQYDYIRLTINQLALDIINVVTSLNISVNNEMDFDNIYNNINDFDIMEDIKEWFILYCKGIIDKLKSGRYSKQKDMINLVVSYIEANYFKSEISTEFVSDIVNLTPGYLGKIFNEYLGKSINEYITELRIKKAKELLEDSSFTVNDVAGKVGFSNQSYFTCIFKKTLGVTPNKYRIDYRKQVDL